MTACGDGTRSTVAQPSIVTRVVRSAGFRILDRPRPVSAPGYGIVVVERDLRDLLRGPLLGRLADDDRLFRLVAVDCGTLVWPGEIDIAPETLTWDGPAPRDEASLRPAAFLRPQPPR